ncbi:hypothetical protein D3C86_1874590 [compost metagenome]
MKHRLVGDDRAAEVAGQDIAGPDDELLGNAAVEAEHAAHFGDLLRLGHVAEHQCGRIAGNETNEREDGYRNDDDRRYRHHEAIEYELDHGFPVLRTAWRDIAIRPSCRLFLT